MGKLFDQSFSIDFTLYAYAVGGATYSDETPASVEMAYTATGSGSRYTVDRTINIINNRKSYTRQLINRLNTTHNYAPYVWANGTTGPSVVDEVFFSENASASTGYRCSLLFGDLNLALTDAMIDKITDTNRPVFSLTTNVGDQRVTLRSLDAFRTERAIVRKTYNANGVLTRTSNSALLTTDPTIEIPIEMELTAARSTAGGSVQFTYKPTQTVYTVKSTGETSTNW